MRAGAALLLPLLLLRVLPAGAPPAPPAPYPLLLVAREACGAREPPAWSQARLERRAAAARFSLLSGVAACRLLGREATCGADWQATLTQHALAALGAGGGVAVAGRLGARAGAAVCAAAGALHRPRPGACGEADARGAALAALARRQRWRRAWLERAAGACGAALTAVERALSSAGVLVRHGTALGDEARVPHVVILCGTSVHVPLWPQTALEESEIVLLLVEEAADPDKTFNVTESAAADRQSDASASEAAKLQSNSITQIPASEGAAPRTAAADYLESFKETLFLHRSGGRDKLTTNSLSSESDIEQSLQENTARTHATQRDRYARTDANSDAAVVDRLLVLSDEFSEFNSEGQSLYDNVLEAALIHIEARRTGMEVFNHNFFLNKIKILGGNVTLRRLGTIATNARQPLGAPQVWAASVALEPAAEQQMAPAQGARDVTQRHVGDAASAALALCAACAAAALLAAGAVCARRTYRNTPRNARASPVLAAADFQFPADERRRVGEGMESMLCWLQQLHATDEPAPELLRPVPAPGPSAPSSSCSASRLAPDGRPRYKGDPVHMKPLPAATLDLRRKAVDVLLVMQSLRHENVNPFIGCLAELRPALVFAAAARGSLEDVLQADDIRLDWPFRLSLLTDLVRGMRYLHQSPVRLHARLSSRNCVVDARWVLRVTDYGLPALAAAQGLPYAPRCARDLLWTAPELLRARSSAAVPDGTQAGDVFSFGIIMQEVLVRGEPYCMLALSPEDLLEKLQRPPPLVRPSVSLGAAPPDAVAIMRQCWSEQPELRPDFARLHELFRHMHRGRKTNIVDSMFEMLEKYSNNLEELIKDRTEQLDMEKKKTEQLLNRMLPPSVAEQLLLGLRVPPEEFEEVSIYFSDIVGFTALAARSTPVQVVDLLNDLYSTFDAAIEQHGVYKVETIGDAYMVVGGLPLRCADHAERVASMALHLLHLAGRFRIRHLPGAPLHLRIGLHSGPCCAGVVGLTMPRYCLFGDTVNTASRMESTGAAWRVQVSGATGARLAAAGGYRLRARGLTQVKGKGAMLTYWLLGKDGFEQPLPTPPPLESEQVLLEAESELDSEPLLPAGAPLIERQNSDPAAPPPAAPPRPSARSGAASAESSPPAPLRRARYLRASASTVTELDRRAGPRALRRQWSLERGESLAAAAAEAPRALPEPLFCAAPARAAPPRYRTRRDASSLDVSAR